MAGNGKAKLSQVVVRLVSTAGTGFYYMTTRRRTLAHKLQLVKYDPIGKFSFFSHSVAS